MTRHEVSERIGRRTALVVLVVCAAGVLAMAGAASQGAAQAGPTYKKVGSWGKTGTGNGQFGSNAYGIATDKAGSVYVADSDNSRIQVFTASGGFQRKLAFTKGESVIDVAVDPDGSAWGTSNQGTRVQQFSRSGAPGETITLPKLGLGVAVDADGNVYAGTAGDNIASVIRFDKASGYAAGKTFGGFQKPGDIEVSPDGTIYMSDTGSLTVKRVDATGKVLKSIKAGPSAPIGVGVDLDCNVWVTNISQRRVDRYSPAGKLLGSATSGDLIGQDIAIGPKGDLYVFDGGTHSVIRFAEDRSKPQAATVGGTVIVAGGKAKVKYTLSGVACPAQVNGTASLSGAVKGKAAVKVPAGRSTTLTIPVKGTSGKATFKIVLKTNGRPTTQTASVSVNVR
jgi:sugar lactone lactonase YvrE